MESYGCLFEKGYAQANSYIANRVVGENSYKVMESGGAIGLKHLTGLDFNGMVPLVNINTGMLKKRPSKNLLSY